MSGKHLFHRLRDQKGPTPHLFFGNCGTNLGYTETELTSLLKEYSVPEAIYLGEGFSFVSFPSSSVASEVLNDLNGKVPERISIDAHKRPLVIRFCKKNGIEKIDDTIPENVSSKISIGLSDIRYQNNILNESEASQLLNSIDEMPWNTKLKRRVQQYGYRFDYNQLRIDTSKRIDNLPGFFEPLISRLMKSRILLQQPDQITVNEYHPGEGIGFHIDTHSSFIGGICTVSLGSDSVMEFRKRLPNDVHTIEMPNTFEVNRRKSLDSANNSVDLLSKIVNHDTSSDDSQSKLSKHSSLPSRYSTVLTNHDLSDSKGGDIVSRHLLLLKKNSACCFDGEARFAYEHGIASRSTDCVDDQIQKRSRRVSITLRTVRNSKGSSGCHCDWSLWCDSQNPKARKHPTRLTL